MPGAHNKTAASWQDLPHTPILLKMTIDQQKSALARICLKSAGCNFIMNLELKP
jgi:hypothetical protein